MDVFENDNDDLKELFENASLHARSLVGKLNSEDLLYLYARFKRAKDGLCDTPRPGFFDFQGKQKWDAWKAMDTVAEDKCMQEYIDKVTELHPSWIDDLKEGKKPKVGFGMGVSRMMVGEGDEGGCETYGLHDLCKEGMLDQLKGKLEAGEVSDVNMIDEHGLAMLHWACDRGHLPIVKLLLQHKAQVNIKDSDEQTPLHYASSCGHEDVVKVLLSYAADTTLKDAEGLSASDVASTETIKILIDASKEQNSGNGG